MPWFRLVSPMKLVSEIQRCLVDATAESQYSNSWRINRVKFRKLLRTSGELIVQNAHKRDIVTYWFHSGIKPSTFLLWLITRRRRRLIRRRLTHTNHAAYNSRAPRSKKWNWSTNFFLVNLRTISGHFCRFHEARDTENARFSVLTNLNQSSRSVLQS